MLLQKVNVDGKPQHLTWTTSPEYLSSGLNISAAKFLEVTDVLLERPNLNSTCLFRADILYDSCSLFQTLTEKEHSHGATSVEAHQDDNNIANNAYATTCPKFEGFTTSRTIVRRLIPRNAQLDRPLDQSCFILESASSESSPREYLVVYYPHTDSGSDLPWYHPAVQALAYHFEEGQGQQSQLSVHYKPLPTASDEASPRLHRTMLSLLQTFIRLAKIETPPKAPAQNGDLRVSSRSTAPSILKDSILPQHLVQDTYARLKQTYAADLMSRWVEQTEPSKHVFEDLSIAAFLIELWKQMYSDTDFPGFIDLACGNGVLVYILNKEGYTGSGYDARRRKTWQILDLKDRLQEKLCIPKPFLELVSEGSRVDNTTWHNGIFARGTFIISNHADELTTWTPLLAFLSNPTCPLPFLAIPCCSHALSGAPYRYTFKDVDIDIVSSSTKSRTTSEIDETQSSSSGDLRALRKEKQAAASHKSDTSKYACLTKKVVALAEELAFDTEMTLIRIPSTRNIGIVGNRRMTAGQDSNVTEAPQNTISPDMEKLENILSRECARDGGVQAAADIWIARARKLQTGMGRGKVNLGGKPVTSSHA